jgi:hypothetical protein
MENQKMLSTQEAVVVGMEGGPGPTGVVPTTAAAEGAGEFSYDAATAPAVIIESGSGQTTSLLSLSLAVFSPSSTLLDSGSDFVSNYVDSANTPVTPGSTTFNLFSSTRSTNTAVFLGSASQVVVTSVPEPATTTVAGIALLAIGGLLRLRRPASSAG